jgi:hypothetical protein
MTPLEKLSLMVFGSIAALYALSWLLAELIVYLTKD